MLRLFYGFIAALTLCAGAAAADQGPRGLIAAPPAPATLSELKVEDGKVLGRIDPNNAMTNMTRQAEETCLAPAGSKFELTADRGTIVVMTYNHQSGEITVGGKTVMFDCPVDTSGMTELQKAVVAKWPLLRAAHPGDGHFTQVQLNAVLEVMDEHPNGMIIAEQTLRRTVGADYRHLMAGAIDPSFNQPVGWFVQTNHHDFVIFQPTCVNGCTLGRKVLIFHLHAGGGHRHSAAQPAAQQQRSGGNPPAAPRRASCPSQITLTVTGDENCTGSCAAVRAAEAAVRACRQ